MVPLLETKGNHTGGYPGLTIHGSSVPRLGPSWTMIRGGFPGTRCDNETTWVVTDVDAFLAAIRKQCGISTQAIAHMRLRYTLYIMGGDP